MRLIYVLVFALSLILTGAAILEWGAAELQKDWREVAFLTLIDAGWLIVATKLFSCLGLSLRDDAVDRKNTAALSSLAAGSSGSTSGVDGMRLWRDLKFLGTNWI